MRFPKFGIYGLPFLLLPCLLLGAGLARGADDTPAKADQAAYDQQIKPLLQQYCYGCHGVKSPAGGINLAAFAEVTAIQKDQTTWRKVLTQIRERNMPPQSVPHPKQEQRDLMVAWLTHSLDSADASLLPNNPGRVLIHRLSRTEYNNTLRDLFGVDIHPADTFPADGGGGGGFDNDANTLFIPPVLMERYLDAAGKVLDAAKPERICFVKPGKGVTKTAAVRKIVAHYAALAFRRPIEKAETDRLMTLYAQATQRGEGFESAVKFTLKAVLISPNFLFRVEADRPITDAYPVSDYELASRLSYFLWASMPDEDLLQLAAEKRLHDPKVIAAQVTRMLRSPKSHAFTESFVTQWLRVRELYTSVHPDPNRFKDYTPTLRDAMYQETVDFFDSVLRDDASLLTLLDANYTYANEELAKHYGLNEVTGSEMRRVSLPDKRRGGLLTMASVLTLTSYPQRTSPVLRGKWVLEEVLGSPVPPPPPVVATLSQDDQPKEGLTFRQRLEKHREKPQCASCHNRMDPLGFGLENFDVTGRWRTEIGGAPVDASGVLTTGEKFSGPIELKQQILARKDEFVHNLTEKLLAYALGRGLEPYDLPTVRKITAAVAKDNYRSSTLVREIALSYPFQYRKNL
ncbi:MAG TPA: DUF1592 domain-containing protein [Chthonomonadaceae bacterium]|nr:DUF1592 domain-containing protein [Chthonomonadaceae bacterium]